VEAQVEALLAIIDEDIPVNFQPYDISKEISLKLGMAYGFHAIPNECLRHLPRRPLMNFPKCRLTFNGLHGFKSQKVELFIVNFVLK
jgi:hypothetical protein